jgi:hypothetical protein
VILQSTGPWTAGQWLPRHLSPLCARGDRCPPELACKHGIPMLSCDEVCQQAHTNDALDMLRHLQASTLGFYSILVLNKPNNLMLGAGNAWAAESARCRCASRSRSFCRSMRRVARLGRALLDSMVARLGYLPISKQLFCKHSIVQ